MFLFYLIKLFKKYFDRLIMPPINQNFLHQLHDNYNDYNTFIETGTCKVHVMVLLFFQ